MVGAMPRALALVTLVYGAACGGSTPPPAQDHRPDGQGEAAPAKAVVETLPAWGSVSPLTSAQARKHGLLAAELDREPRSEVLLAALASDEPSVRDRAALSLARVGGSAAAEYFLAWVGDGSRPASAAVFGAIATLAPPDGPPGEASEPTGVWAQLETALWSRYAVTEDPAEAEALLLAAARIGGQASVRNLAADLAVLPSSADAARFERGAEALAVLCVRRHPLTAAALTAVGEGLAADSVAARRGSAYALSRCAGPSAERLAGAERGVLVERLGPMLTAADPDEALAAWRALEALGEPAPTLPPSVLGADPPPWQVEVAAVRGMGSSAAGRKELATRLGTVTTANFGGARIHVLLEALRVLRPSVEGAPELLEPFVSLANALDAETKRSADAHDTKGFALARCELQALQAVRSGQLDALRTCAAGIAGLPESYGSVLAIDVLLAMGAAMPAAQRVDQVIAAAGSPDRAVSVAAVSGLAELDDPRVNPLLRKILSTDDVGLVSAAAGAIAARAVDGKKRDADAVEVLGQAITRLTTDNAVEARIEAIRALGSLGRSAPRPKAADGAAPVEVPWLGDLVALATDGNQAVRDAARAALSGWDARVAEFDAAQPTRFPQGFSPPVHAALDAGSDATGLRVQTAAGTFTVRFAGAPAPIAQANLAVLARAGYFDGLTVHRVVPAFVVQGGDPRGDGYGGPGHVMPCEWSNLRYERGTVGIALAGKDTGGSQIFVSHGAPHHLDARYPVIGRVVDGLDVIDRLLPFDAIEVVEVLVE